MGSFSDDDEITRPGKKLHDEERRTDPRAREKANVELVRAAYLVRLEGENEILKRQLAAARERIEFLTRELRKLRARRSK